jgi:EpsI family protein
LPLRANLDEVVPIQIEGLPGRDLEISAAERRVAGMTAYVMRVFSPSGEQQDLTRASFSIYVGYYDQQMRGKTIHSPKNCLPGAGWEALTSTPTTIETPSGSEQVTRFLLQRGNQKAVVLYWYQGRGRIEANEYAVKWQLLRDAAVRRRSDEALVRIVVPVTTTESEALAVAKRVAAATAPAVYLALPE